MIFFPSVLGEKVLRDDTTCTKRTETSVRETDSYPIPQTIQSTDRQAPQTFISIPGL